MKELEKESYKVKDRKKLKIVTMDKIIAEAVKQSPKMDLSRQDMQRGEYYWLTGGDPDTRNQI